MKTSHKAMIYCSFNHYELEVSIGCFHCEKTASAAAERTKVIVDLGFDQPGITLLRDGDEIFVSADELQLKVLSEDAQSRLGKPLDVSVASEQKKAVEALGTMDPAYVVTEEDFFTVTGDEVCEFLTHCGDGRRLHVSSYRVTSGSTASDEELEDVDCFDPKLIDGVTCVLVEPVPNDETSLTVTGEGIFSERNGEIELRGILAKINLPWSHEVINRGPSLWFGHQKVMGWRVTLGVRQFLEITKPYQKDCSARLGDWFREIGKFGEPIELTIMCSKKFWTVFDHLKGDYQKRAGDWASACFGEDAAINHFHRRNRFIEEAIELHQAAGGTADEIIQLVTHVYNKPTGDPHQEVGGAMVTLATLCNALGVDLLHAGEDELARVWEEFPRIRAKQASAQAGSPLPGKVDV